MEPLLKTLRVSSSFERRFWDKVAKGDSCWLWMASVDKKGYGQINNGIKPYTMLKAHRTSWIIHKSDPGELCVLHRCDTPACVNPEHLFLGTTADNNQDMWSKGRNRFQKSNPSSKLSVEQVGEIRQLRSDGIKLRDLAAQFNVAESTISRIANGVRREFI